jgi:hypothetical protein
MIDQTATATDNTATGSEPTATATSADLTKTAAPQGAATATDPNAAKSDEGAAKTGEEAKPPIEYVAPTMPEGMTMDADLLAAATPILAKHGASQELLNELSAVYAERLKALGAGGAEAFDQAYQDRREAEITETDEKWVAAVKADKEIGGKNFEAAKQHINAVVGKFGSPEFKAAMNETRFGNHPEFAKFIHRIATQGYTPPEFGETPAGAGGSVQDKAAILYPNDTKR